MRIPESARAVGAATATLWGAAVLIFCCQADRMVTISAGTTQLIVYWLLAVGSTGFWIAFLRVGEELVHVDWHLAYEINPEVIFVLRRNRHLDRVLARGLAADRQPEFWPTGTWTLFAWIGAAFWALSAAATVALATHAVRMGPPHRGIFLVMLLLPAVQCTAASVIGPGLTRMLELREAAREARRLLCDQDGAPATTEPSGPKPSAAAEDLTATVPIGVQASRETRRQAAQRHLRVVGENVRWRPD